MSTRHPCVIRVEDGARWRLSRGQRYTLGRDLCNHFVADSSSVSNRQVELWVEGDRVAIEDGGLAPVTKLDGAALGGVARVDGEARLETGRVEWRIAFDGGEAELPAVFTLETATERLLNGAKQKLPYRRWTRGWRDFAGRPVNGLLGPTWGAFWFRVFATTIEPHDDPVHVFGAIDVEQLTRPLTESEARAGLEQRHLSSAEHAPMLFTLAEVFGVERALAVARYPGVRGFTWLGPMPAAQVETIVEGLRDIDEVMAVANGSGVSAIGIRRILELPHATNWEVERRLVEAPISADDKLELALELDLQLQHLLISHVAEHGSEAAVAKVHDLVTSGRTSTGVSVLVEAALPEYAAGVLKSEFVSRTFAGRPNVPVPPKVVKFCVRGGEQAAATLIRMFDEHPDAVAETFALMPDEHLIGLWDSLPEVVRAAVEDRFGPPTGGLPELPAAEFTDWMERWRKNVPFSEEVYLLGGPRMVTRSGYRLPVDVERGLFCALDDVDFRSQPNWDQDLRRVGEVIEPRSAWRALWWQLSHRWEPDRSYSRDMVNAAAAFFLEDRDVIELHHEVEDTMEVELWHSKAPIAPMLLWLQGWEYRREVPEVAEDTFDQWDSFTEWALDRLPRRLPANADEIACQWFAAHAVDGTRFGVPQWRRLVTETWIGELVDQLVWVGLGDGRCTFRTDAGEFVGVDGERVEFGEIDLVHLAHAMDLEPALRADWSQHLAEHEVTSVFDQLNAGGLRDAASTEALIGQEIRHWALRGWDRGYKQGRADDMDLRRSFGVRGRVIARVRSGKLTEIAFMNEHGRRFTGDEIDRVMLACTVRDFEAAAGSGW